MPKRTGDYDAWMIGELTDPQLAASYVNAAISEDPDMLKVALGNVAKAHRMKVVAEEAGIARESLYTSYSEVGNPTLSNLNAVLKAVGLKIAVVPCSEESSVQEAPPEIAVEDRLGIDSSASKAIKGLTKAGNISMGIPQIVGIFAEESQPETGCFSFKTHAGLGAYAYASPTMRTTLGGFRNVFKEQVLDQSGVADSGKNAFGPVEAYVGQPACQAGNGSPQPAR